MLQSKGVDQHSHPCAGPCDGNLVFLAYCGIPGWEVALLLIVVVNNRCVN